MSEAHILMVPAEKVAKSWHTFYWPFLEGGLRLRPEKSSLLSGNILEAVLTDKLMVVSFWWVDGDKGRIVTLALVGITKDSITGVKCLRVYSLSAVRKATPIMLKAFIAQFKKFMVSKKIDILISEITNSKWADLIVKLDPEFKQLTSLYLEVKR